MIELQVVTDKFVGLIIVDKQGFILAAAPILRKFVGQNVANLLLWIQRSFKEAKLIHLHDFSILYEKSN